VVGKYRQQKYKLFFPTQQNSRRIGYIAPTTNQKRAVKDENCRPDESGLPKTLSCDWRKRPLVLFSLTSVRWSQAKLAKDDNTLRRNFGKEQIGSVLGKKRPKRLCHIAYRRSDDFCELRSRPADAGQ
jgi:hypothetical protein